MKNLLLGFALLLTCSTAFSATDTNCSLKGKWAVYYTSDMFKSVKKSYSVDSVEDCLNKVDQLFHSETRSLYDYDTGREFILHLRYVKYKFTNSDGTIEKGKLHNNVTEW